MTEETFYKYQGTGNDFVVLDNRDGRYTGIKPQSIARLCDRRFGIGADGLLLLSKHETEPFRMEYFNSDGSRATFCGNGARCICAFAARKGIVREGIPFTFVADDATHTAMCYAGRVNLKMVDVVNIERVDEGFFMNTGVPHVVSVVDDLDKVDIMAQAPKIRFSPRFEPTGGTNVNFVRLESPNSLSVRTYERGVEGETLACGTGIVASAISASLLTHEDHFEVTAKGGRLKVNFTTDGKTFTDISLDGPAQPVFEGLWYGDIMA